MYCKELDMPSDRMEDFQRLKNTLGGGGQDAGKVISLLAQARLQLDRNNFSKAKEYAEKVLKLSPANQEAQELITRANRAEKGGRAAKPQEDKHKIARTKAEEAKKKMEEAKKKAAAAEVRKFEEEEKLRLAEEDAIKRAEEARRLVEEAEARRKEAEKKRLEEEERLRVAMEEARRSEEEARHRAEEARKLAEEEEARRRAEEELRKKEEEERRRKADETRKKAQEEAALRKRVEQITKLLAQARMRISAHKFDEAREYIENALEIDQQSREVQAMIDRLEAAEAEYMKEEGLRKQEEEAKRLKEAINENLKTAESLIKDNDFDGARKETQKVFEIDEHNTEAEKLLEDIDRLEEEYKKGEENRLEEEKIRQQIEEERKKAVEEARKRSVEDSRKRSEQEIQEEAKEARRIAAEELRKTAGIESRKKEKEEARKKAEEAYQEEEQELPEIKVEEKPRESEEELAIKKEREEAFRFARQESLMRGEEEARKVREEEEKKQREEEEIIQKWMQAAEEHLENEKFTQARAEVEKVLEAERKNRPAKKLLKKIIRAEKIQKKQEIRQKKEEEARKRAEERLRIREEEEAERMAAEEAREKAAEEERKRKEEEDKKKAAEEAKIRAEEEKRRAEEEKIRAKEEEARRRQEEEIRKKQEEEYKKRAAEEAKIKAEEEKRKAKEEAERRRQEEEDRKRKEEEDKKRAAEEEKRRAEEEKRRAKEEEARKKAEEERQRALEEARRKAEEDARKKLEIIAGHFKTAREIVKDHKFDEAREEVQKVFTIDSVNKEAKLFLKEIDRFERAYKQQQARIQREQEAARIRVEEDARQKVIKEDAFRRSQLLKGHLQVARESLANKEFDKAREYTNMALDVEIGNKEAKKFLREIDKYESMYRRKEEQLKRDEKSRERLEEEDRRREEANRRRLQQEEAKRAEEERRTKEREERLKEAEEAKRRQQEERERQEEEKRKRQEVISGHLSNARQCMGSHAFDLAKADVEKALEVDPSSREARQLLKEIARAEKAYHKHQERIKREEERKKIQEEEEAKRKALEEARKREKHEEVSKEREEKGKALEAAGGILKEARQNLDENKFEEARTHIQKALEIDSKNAEARKMMKEAVRAEKLHHKELKKKTKEEAPEEEGRPAGLGIWMSKFKEKGKEMLKPALSEKKKEVKEDLFESSQEKEKPEVEGKNIIKSVLGLKYISKGKKFIAEGGWKKIDPAKIKKNYIWIIIGLLITAFVLAHTIGKMKQVFFKGKEEEREGAQFTESIPVKAYKTKRMDFKDTLPVLGRIEGFKEIELRFGEGGILESFNFEEGERILEGDIIASLDQKDALLKLKYASIEMEKANRLLEIGGIDKAATDQKKLEYESAKRDLEKTNIYAASDGYLGSKEAHSGAYITPQDKIGVFVDFSEVYAAFDVIEEDSPKIELGQNAEIFLDAYPGATYKGTVDMVAPMIEGRTRTQKVKIELSNESDELRPGMFARAIINTYEKQDALIIPASAFKKIENKYYVFVVHPEEEEVEGLVEEEGEAVDAGLAGAETGIVEQREIKIVYLTHDVAEIGKGLKEGELVIREIHQEFKDKDKVEITEVQETIF